MSWRPMTSGDLAHVQVLADTIHVEHPEEPHVFSERLRLYPQGCAVLEVDGRLIGYALTHPWRYGEPPSLNSHLEHVPSDATTYYVHDVALLPEARGMGYAVRIGEWLVDHAARGGFPNLSLVAVNGSQPFWERLGFRVAAIPGLASKLLSYGPDAVLMVRDLAQDDR
ncbi:MAG: GNAT family N-acetyltransferase [Microvirga sp.]